MLAVTLVSVAAAPAATAAPIAGRYFPEGGGFAVTNEDGVPFWDAFQALGGVGAAGYPVSRRFMHDGFITQAMQKAVFQWRPDAGVVSYVNVFDDLARLGKDDWLLAARATPRPLPPNWDGAAEWAMVVRTRIALMDARPAIRRRYDATPNALQRLGLPTSPIVDMGNHYAVRLQRAVIQEWKVDVPWARVGETTFANGGDIMKEAGLVPLEATVAEPANPELFAGPAPRSSERPAPVVAPSSPPPASAPAAGTDLRLVADVATVRRGPSDASVEVARVFRNAQVEVVGPAGGAWLPVRLWNALGGWLPRETVTHEPYPERDDRRGGGYRRGIPANPASSTPLPVDLWARVTAPSDLLNASGTTVLARLTPPVLVRVVGYSTEASRTWYEVQAGDQRGWIPPASVDLIARDPQALGPSGRPIAAAAGKGMWATYDLLDRVSPEGIVETARANGLTHIYLQVGRTNLGFYGAAGLDRLLPVAHANGVAVIAWVYPFLRDTTADVYMTMQAARYVTPDGHRPAALAADVEENMTLNEVQAYGQLVRGMLGDDHPMIVATYPPEMAAGRTYPFAAVAKSWNVIAPMDYYRRPGRAYTTHEAHGYVARSIQLIRERAGRPVSIAPIGQAYGMQWPNETGPTNPSGDETVAMMRAAREGGAVGISFFEWAHATAPQWRAIGAFRW